MQQLVMRVHSGADPEKRRPNDCVHTLTQLVENQMVT
jgi:hypothetical protein